MSTLKWTLLALLFAAVAVAGTLYLSLGLGLQACPLCFYQRTFAMAVLGVLLVGLLAGVRRGPLLSVLALPLATGGLAVAGFHVYLEATGKLECPKGIADLGSAPQQSLAALGLLFAALMLDVLSGCCQPAPADEGSPGPVSIIAALALGGLFAYGCIKSTPPAPKPDYSKPLLGCRPPEPPKD
jgi:disulfide bond formation protein DsbB